MKIINPGIEFKWCTPDMLDNIKDMGKLCYMSEPIDTTNFMNTIIKKGHESVLEHGYVSFIIITDRGVANQLVRHRICNYSQTSTRFCNYSKNKFGHEIAFIRPYDINISSEEYMIWKSLCQESENKYMKLIELGKKPETARSVLPLSTATNIGITTNIREWRHILKERYFNKTAQIDMREVMSKIYEWFLQNYPILVEDLEK